MDGRVDEEAYGSTKGTVGIATEPREDYDATFHMSISTEQCPTRLLNFGMSVSARSGGRVLDSCLLTLVVPRLAERVGD